jgi:hypothetical protein
VPCRAARLAIPPTGLRYESAPEGLSMTFNEAGELSR